MLASLLPGLRDLRTPLATGFTWLVALWLALGPSRLMPGATNPFFKRIHEYSDVLGTGVTLATLSFVAYLLGSLLTVRQLGFTGRTQRFLLRIPVAGWLFLWLAVAREWPQRGESSERLRGWVDEQVGRLVSQGRSVDDVMNAAANDLPKDLVENVVHWREHSDGDASEPVDEAKAPSARHAADVQALSGALRQWVWDGEQEALVIKLQLERESLYDAYDRLNTEAELRYSLLLPLAVIVISAGRLWTDWAYLLLAVVVILGWQGLRIQTQAYQRLVQALTSGVIQSSVITTLLEAQRPSIADRQIVEQRADAAAEASYEYLAQLEEAIPRWHSYYVTSAPDVDPEDKHRVRSEHDAVLASLEARIVMLSSPQREALTSLLDVLRYAYDLPERGSGIRIGYHPDTASHIASACVRYGRQVIASHLRRESLPPVPDQVNEYFLAIADRNKELNSDFAEEIHESDEALARWRSAHDLSKTRTPW